ncbi:etoposide-induced protein 2.4 [Megavirus baoshan]|uniref:Etoposide-induced protein 2.4 n=1 Tax=Megavirus baoshan TaxID=2496520 RepID=A0A3Q8U822_9VIRU|nr:etoposide-induced protein 2.4 [Megavirus baoshan]AZL89533.1 etoposide-induced protein 2.4 [Megavirus baoshan]
MSSVYQNIIKDLKLGLHDSIRIDKLGKIILNDTKIFKCLYKIVKYNIILYIIPYLFVSLINFLIGFNLFVLLDWLIYPIDILSCFFHVLQYIDLISCINKYTTRPTTNKNNMNYLSLSITMTIYQLVIFITTIILDFFFKNKLNYLSAVLKIFILSIYHSFYCFNNLWQYKQITLYHRIDIHEKLWPYHLGFGFFATIIYVFNNNYWISGVYNIYMSILVCMPFINKTKYPNKLMEYKSINLKPFLLIIKYTMDFVKKIFGI